MTTDKLDLVELREAAEWAVEVVDPEESWHDSEAWWAEDERVKQFIAEAGPHTILTLIARIEAAEVRADRAWDDSNDLALAKLHGDLVTAAKLIEELVGALVSVGRLIEELVGALVSVGRYAEIPFQQLSVLATAKDALALHDLWKKGDNDES